MEQKLYSLEHIAKTYKVDVEKLQKWASKKYVKNVTTGLPGSLNNKIAILVFTRIIINNFNSGWFIHNYGLLIHKIKTKYPSISYFWGNL